MEGVISQEMQVLLIRLTIDLIATYVLVRMIYYNTHKNKDFLFTFGLFNVLIFLISALLSSASMEMGFAFGLFAIFSFIRYRTVTVPIKEMGYLFATLTIGIINALATPGKGFSIIILCNLLILGLILILDRYIHLSHENMKDIVYERIDLITPQKRDEMIEDLIKRTGLPIHRVEIRSVNFLRDTAKIVVFYYATENENKVVAGISDDS